MPYKLPKQRYKSCANALRPGPQPAARQSWAELRLVLASEIAGLDQSVVLSTAN